MKKIVTLFMLITVICSNLPIVQIQLLADELRDVTITGLDDATLSEETTYTDELLITIYNVTTTASPDSVITVDDSAVLYDTPGDYPITFTVTDAVTSETASFESNTTIADKVPIVTLTNGNGAYKLGATPNYTKDYDPHATEVSSDDMTDQIVIDDSEVEYGKEGTYNVYFRATDEEGNVGQAVGTVNFYSTPPTITVNTPSASTPEEVELTNDQLITLFNITAEDDDGLAPITVDDSQVDYNTPGDYPVYAKATDIYDIDSIEQTLNLTITDQLPEISLASDRVEVAAHDTPDYVDLFGAVATEITAGDLTTAMTIDSSSVNTNRPGEYPVYFSVVDEEGNEATATGTVVVEYVAPTITADSEQTIKEEDSQLDSELQALFNVEYTHMGVSTFTVDQSAVDYSTPGDYPVVFTIEDDLGGSASTTSTLHIENIPPTITVEYDYVVEHVGKKPNYIKDFGITASEFESGDLNRSVVVDDSAVNYYQEGKYTVYFTATDSDGYTATAQGTLSLKNDVPLVTASVDETIDEGEPLTDQQLIDLFGISATDSDGLDQIIIDDSAVNYDKPGNYDVYITATDIYGAVSAEHHAILRINDVVPTLEVNNRIAFAHAGSTVDFQDAFGYTATEFTTGDLTDDVIVDDSQVVYNEVGPYDVVFTVSDNDGNTLTETHTLVITDDSPDITSKSYAFSPEGLSLSAQDLLHLFDVQITDQDAIKNVAVDSSDIDFNTPGLYYVGFLAEDEYGVTNSKYYAKFVVTDTKPTIELATTDATIHIGSDIDYVSLFGPSATEVKPGDLNSLITIDSSEVDASKTGTYPVTFAVADNEANSVNTTGNLTIENDNPVISLDSTFSSPEHTELNNQQYIDNLNIVVTDTDQIDSITIDDSAVDYQTPGTYSVTVNANDIYDGASEASATIEITDILPSITSESDSIEVGLNQVVDYISKFGLVATEFTSGDLTDQIVIDDTKVDLTTVGTYPLIATVADQEGNAVTTNLTVKVVDDPELNVITDQPNNDDTSNSNSNISASNSDNNNSNDQQQSTADQYASLKLSSTGSKLLGISIIALIIIVIIKVVLNKTTKN